MARDYADFNALPATREQGEARILPNLQIPELDPGATAQPMLRSGVASVL
jgi:hypothetical protein